MSNVCATAAISAIGWTVPTSLLAHITLTSATESGSASMAVRTVSGCTRPTWSTSSQVTLAPSCASRKSTQSRTAWCSTTLTKSRTRRGSTSRRAQNKPLMARLSDSVPPEVNSTSAVSYTHLRAHETDSYLVCRLLLEKKKKTNKQNK